MKVVVNNPEIIKSNSWLEAGLCWSFGKILNKDEVEQVSPYVTCRDYLGEFRWSSFTGKPLGSFAWFDGTKLEKDFVCLLVTFLSEVQKTQFLNHIHEIHVIEKQAGWHLTDLTDCGPRQLMICGDGKWMSNLFLLSIYTFLLKVFSFKYKTNWQAGVNRSWTEDNYYEATKTYLPYILSHLNVFVEAGKGTVTGYPNETTLVEQGMLHGTGGFVSLIRATTYENQFIKNNSIHQKLATLTKEELAT